MTYEQHQALLAEQREDLQTFLLDYISESKRSETVTITEVSTDSQTFTVNRQITYGDITVSALLIFLLVYTVGRQLFTDIRGGL